VLHLTQAPVDHIIQAVSGSNGLASLGLPW
jgi:hypothetical protein